MRRTVVPIFAVVALLMSTTAYAVITWEDPYYTFRYGVDKNGGTFYYSLSSPPYFNSNKSTAVLHYDPSQGQYAPYNGIAWGDLIEFPGSVPGQIQLRAMAKGPDGGVPGLFDP